MSSGNPPVPRRQSESHADLVRVAENWLRGSRRCAVVLTEKGCGGEVCDAIGWGQRTIVVECKTSRADFFADLKKPHRQAHAEALGQERWYLTRPGLITANELPDRWGLLEWTGRIVRRRVVAAVSPETTLQRRYELRMVLYELAAYQAQGITYDVFRGRTGGLSPGERAESTNQPPESAEGVRPREQAR